MNKKWEQIYRSLAQKNAEILNDLNPPASLREIKELEDLIQATLPIEFINCLRVHNGQVGKATGLFNGLVFLSTQAIANEWGIWRELVNTGGFEGENSQSEIGIQQDWWNILWVPFTSDSSGNHTCIDLMPTQEGTVGQVIQVWHDEPERSKLATSFSEWFNQFI